MHDLKSSFASLFLPIALALLGSLCGPNRLSRRFVSDSRSTHRRHLPTVHHTSLNTRSEARATIEQIQSVTRIIPKTHLQNTHKTVKYLRIILGTIRPRIRNDTTSFLRFIVKSSQSTMSLKRKTPPKHVSILSGSRHHNGAPDIEFPVL